MKINNNIESLHQNLIDIINQYNNLPVGVVYYVLKDCFNEVEQAYKMIIEKERQSVEDFSSTPHKLQPDEVEEVKENNN